MKQLVLKLDVNDEQDVNRALDRIARISGKYEITMDKTSKLCTVKGDDIDPIQIVGKLRKLCHVDIVAVEPPKEPEKKKEELVEVAVNASSLAAAIGPSKEPKKKEEELEKEEPEKKKEELVEEVVNASSLAAAIGPSKEPKKKEEELEKEEPTKQEEKKKGEEIITDVKEDPNETFRAGAMMKAVFKLGLDDEKSKRRAMQRVSCVPGVDSISMDMKDKKLTVVGNIDAANIVGKLRKICRTDIISVGPAKEPEKKKEEPKKAEPKKPEDDKKDKDALAELVKAYKAYNPNVTTHYHVRSVEDDPNACVIS